MYVENGELRVVSTDPTIALSTVSAVAAGVLNAAGRRDLAQRAGVVQVVAGDHSFVALNDWLLEIRPVLHEHGVHSVSIDEVANSIRLATEFSHDAEDLRDRVREKGIPESAVTVDVRERARFNHTYGGQEVTIRFPGFVFDGPTCTLTQVVEHRLPDGSLDSDLYGITNSHCTQDFGQAFGDRFMSGETGVATEVWTHPMFTNPACEALMGQATPTCRYSDASLFRYSSSVLGDLHPHQIRIWQFLPYLYGLHTETIVFMGEVVNRWGAQSGLDFGEVKATCTDEGPLTTHEGDAQHSQQVGLLCQYAAEFPGVDGDSGGPVWAKEDWGEPWGERRMFAGIYWGFIGELGFFSGAYLMSDEIVPSGSGWGTICLSHAQAVPGSTTCAW